MKRLKSMDVTIHGVTRSYEWDPALEVSSDDEGEASLEVLEDASTTEVVLSGSIDCATVTVEYTYRFSGSVEVSLDSLDVEDADDLVNQVEQGDFYAVTDAITEDVGENISDDCITFDSVVVDRLYDEDGDEVEQ